MDAFMGMIVMFGFNWPPRSWELCNGQTIAISQNQALFSLLGTQFGGDGRTTFALPDLRGRAPIHYGTGPGLSPYNFGARSGLETQRLTPREMPSHNHTATAESQLHAEQGAGSKASPTGKMLAGAQIYNDPDPQDNKVMAAESVQTTVTVGYSGEGLGFSIVQPYLAVSYCICVQGLYPSRH